MSDNITNFILCSLFLCFCNTYWNRVHTVWGSKILEKANSENREDQSYNALLFLHERPWLISVLSLGIGIVFSLGEFFFQYGNFNDIFDMIIIGTVFRSLRTLFLLILTTITILLSFLYKKKDDNKLLLILPEVLLIVTLFAFLGVNVKDFFYYICYSIVETPSCFPIEFYTVVTSLMVFMAIFFVKLLNIDQSRQKYLSQLVTTTLDDKKEEEEEKLNDTSKIQSPPNFWRLLKESFSPESVWKWKYNSRRHFVMRFTVSFSIMIPLLIGAYFLTLYILNSI